MSLVVADAGAMEHLGGRLARATEGGGLIDLEGELGVGKTTMVRGFLRAQGYAGKVRSPTYTLVETYTFNSHRTVHLDLYRLAHPEELEWIGARDIVTDASVALVEWPERGAGFLPTPDLVVRINYEGTGRRVDLFARTEKGQGILRLMDFADS